MIYINEVAYPWQLGMTIADALACARGEERFAHLFAFNYYLVIDNEFISRQSYASRILEDETHLSLRAYSYGG